MYTEEEAKEKWCPMVRLHCVDSHCADNRLANNYELPDGTLCIASECMMWRWHSANKEYGYCGLAGKEKQ